MSGEFYDPDEVLPRSPGLVPTQVEYKPGESPQPFVPESSSSPSPEAIESETAKESACTPSRGHHRRSGKNRRRKGRTRASQGDAVLISYLAPNRPDIAQLFGQSALNSASQSEAEEEEEDMGSLDNDEGAEKTFNAEGANGLANAASAALAVVNDVGMGNLAERSVKEEDQMDMPITNGNFDGQSRPGVKRGDPTGFQGQPASDAVLSSSSLRTSRPVAPSSTDRDHSEDERSREEDSIVISPHLVKFAISPLEGDRLPAMQKSPPRSASTHSPDGIQRLPSLQTTLSQISDSALKDGVNGVGPFGAMPGQSPKMSRTQYHPQHSGPSPSAYSSQPSPGMSPPGIPSHPSFWRPAPKEGSYSSPSVYEVSAPASVPSQSPASSYPTPGSQDQRMSIDASSKPQLMNRPLSANGPFTSSAFKCTHPDCNAPPFQTQYLLNSHANVHSSNRPHFCSEKDCSRGPGGKGFKRKNEMIRHGLVHSSPGYVCPFCPDQQHRYPRPDNLQRHVRVHHVDKDRDDAELRAVLAQRPEGGNRGRRRRLGT